MCKDVEHVRIIRKLLSQLREQIPGDHAIAGLHCAANAQHACLLSLLAWATASQRLPKRGNRFPAASLLRQFNRFGRRESSFRGRRGTLWLLWLSRANKWQRGQGDQGGTPKEGIFLH